MRNFLLRLWKEEEGQDLIEYGLLLVFIALVAVASLTSIRTAIQTIFNNAATNLTSAAAGT
jgi:pilus assembly protein Flp/PilA